MAETSIIYYTDNCLEPFLTEKCQAYLVKAANGKRIISVSQKPIEFGDNLCVGDIGRSHHSLFYQTLMGAQEAKTRYIALAEHDCLYTTEHFDWVPPDDAYFWYNVNHWLADWNSDTAGMYSYYRRKVMSQLICERNIYIRAIEEKLKMLDAGATIRKGQPGACEPGVCDNRIAFLAELAKLKDVGKETFQAKSFATMRPNIDIRHGGNFSGGRRAQKRRYWIDPWGSLHSILGVKPPGDWYQEAVIDGNPMPTKRKVDTSARRWRSYIAPFIQKGVGTCVDLGANAGLYCRNMADLGYRAIGVEKDEVYIRHAHYWEGCEPKGVVIVEKDILNYQIPVCNYALMALVHYWLERRDLEALIHKLGEQAVRVVVMGRHKRADTHKMDPGMAPLTQLFSGWKVEGSKIGKKYYSVLFKNRHLDVLNVNQIWPKQQVASSRWLYPSLKELIEFVRDGTKFVPQHTKFYHYLESRKFKPLDKAFAKEVALIKSVLNEGLTQPLMCQDQIVLDGVNRLVLAKTLGIETIIARRG
jgi:hypothetical protein